MYSSSYCRCSFEPEIIKIGQSSHKIYSNNIVNFQESKTILNACTKKSGNLLNVPRIYIYIYISKWVGPRRDSYFLRIHLFILFLHTYTFPAWCFRQRICMVQDGVCSIAVAYLHWLHVAICHVVAWMCEKSGCYIKSMSVPAQPRSPSPSVLFHLCMKQRLRPHHWAGVTSIDDTVTRTPVEAV